MEKRKIAVLAPFTGVINRGGETFAIELTRYLKNHYDVVLFTWGQNLKEDIPYQSVEMTTGFVFNTYRKLVHLVQKISQKPAQNLLERPIILFFKLIYRIIFEIYEILPDEFSQRSFTRQVFRQWISKGDFDAVFPVNGINGVRRALKWKNGRKDRLVLYSGQGGIGKGEKKILLSGVDIYVALTEVAENWARQFHPCVVRIPNGVNSSRFVPEKKENHYEKPVVLCVAAFTAFKRQKLLIDAMARLGKGTLILAGDGELKKSLSEYAIKLLGSRVVITSVSYQEIPGLYQVSDVFSLPSQSEPLGIVYLEAMSSNLPVVAPDDEFRQFVVGDAGVLCDVTEPEEYAAAIRKAVETDWGNRQRERVLTLFSWDVIGAKYLELFNQFFKNAER